jgi:pyruvate/2-oxoglutarate dehydrogenase complex dihydrolipoamide dehydrogenase (E3) component
MRPTLQPVSLVEANKTHWPLPSALCEFIDNQIRRTPNLLAMESVEHNNVEHYDCIAIGSGEAGKLVPFLLSGQHGKKCAIIERKWIGGSCPNIACLPSKSVIHAANLAHEARMTNKHGLEIPGAQSLKSNLQVVKKRKSEMVKAVNGFQDLFEKFDVELIHGEGRFVSPTLIQVSGGRLLTAKNIVICTGSRAVVDASIPGLVEAKPMTHIEILDLEVLPSHLVIIGGGYVGLEFAQAYRRFGSEVTVIQRGAQVLPKEDKDVVDCLSSILEDEGIRLLTGTTVESVEGTNGDKVTVHVVSSKGKLTLHGSHLLIAAGRTPNVEDLDLAKAGLALTAAGHISVNDQLQTAVPHIFAAGDCAGSPYFTHMGWDDHRIILRNIIGSPRPEGTRGRQVPSTLFTSPELAHVGLHQKEADARGIEYRLVKASMGSTFLRTHTIDQIATAGFAKCLLAKDSDRILGFTALAPGAGELLPVVSLAMAHGLGYQAIRDLIFAHPTLNEGLPMFFLGVEPL